MLPQSLAESLKNQLGRVIVFHDQDIKNGIGTVYLPNALDRKYPNAGLELAWQYMFPAAEPAVDPRSGLTRRHHLGEQAFQRAIKKPSGQQVSINPPLAIH